MLRLGNNEGNMMFLICVECWKMISESCVLPNIFYRLQVLYCKNDNGTLVSLKKKKKHYLPTNLVLSLQSDECLLNHKYSCWQYSLNIFLVTCVGFLLAYLLTH